MTGGFSYEIDLFDENGLGIAFREAIGRGKDLTPVLTIAGSVMENSIRNRFDTGVGPGNVPWPISERANYQGGKTLVDSGGLEGSVRSEVSDDSVTTGIDGLTESARYAYVHQNGMVIKPKKGDFLVFPAPDGTLRFARSVRIPARPMVGIDENDLTDLEDAFLAYAQEPFL